MRTRRVRLFDEVHIMWGEKTLPILHGNGNARSGFVGILRFCIQLPRPLVQAYLRAHGVECLSIQYEYAFTQEEDFIIVASCWHCAYLVP